tara:strand:- start:97 stop:327 length:231 start_codon:yes stop_codon:yes gene_type:complete
MKTKKEEATLLGYKILYNRAGKLITERTITDITELKPYFTDEEYATLKSVLREGSIKLDELHNHIESNLNARKMTE